VYQYFHWWNVNRNELNEMNERIVDGADRQENQSGVEWSGWITGQSINQLIDHRHKTIQSVKYSNNTYNCSVFPFYAVEMWK
jgi:hypothetical protein